MSDGWDGDDFDEQEDDPYGDAESDADYVDEVIEEIYENLDVQGQGEWRVTITTMDGQEYTLFVPIELVWEIRDFAIEFGIEFDYEYEGA